MATNNNQTNNSKGTNNVKSNKSNIFKFTPSQEEFIIDNYLNMTLIELANHIGNGCTPLQVNSKISYLCVQHKVVRNKKFRFTNQELDFIEENHKTLSIQELSKRLKNAPQKNIENVIKRIKAKGSAYDREKVRINNQRDAFISENYEKLSIPKMSEELGISQGAVLNRIKRMKLS